MSASTVSSPSVQPDAASSRTANAYRIDTAPSEPAISPLHSRVRGPTTLAEYRTAYPNVALDRVDGVLEVTLHDGRGGPFVMTARAHADLGFLWQDIANDPETGVVVLTGTGDSFCAASDFGDPTALMTAPAADALFDQARRILINLLAIEVPIVTAVNGPATIHADLVLLGDVVLAADTAAFQDANHALGGLAPADGLHVILPAAMGLTRARYFLLTGQTLDAREAQRVGLVHEVVAPEALLPRARAVAQQLMMLPAATRKYARIALNHRVRKELLARLGSGLAMEGTGLVDLPNELAAAAARS